MSNQSVVRADNVVAQIDMRNRAVEMMQFAEAIQNASFVPKSIKGDKAAIFYLLATAEEMGAKWMHALRSCFATPEGKIGFQWDFIAAILLSNGFKIEWPETNATRAICRITRPDGASHEETFGVVDAQLIKYWNTKSNGWSILASKFNWVSYPKNMCMARAGMNCARAIAADIMGGIYTPDEIEGLPPENADELPAPSENPDDYHIGTTSDPEPPSTGESVNESAQGTEAAQEPSEMADTTRRRRRQTAQQQQPAAATQAATAQPTGQQAPEPAQQAPAPAAATPAAAAAQDTTTTANPASKEEELRLAFGRITEKIIKGTSGSADACDAKKARKLMTEFACGFTGERSAPQNVDAYVTIIPAMERSVEGDLSAFIKDPKQAGYNAKNGTTQAPDPIANAMKIWGWGTALRQQVDKFVADYYPDNADGFIKWINFVLSSVLKGDHKVLSSVEDVNAFLSAADISKPDAVNLVEMAAMPVCIEANHTLELLFKQVVSMTKKPVEDLNKESFGAAVKEVQTAIEKISKQSEPDPTQKEESDTLPFMS